jgi:hypothetical protein
LKGYDYSRTGAHYVTVVARRQECLFGEAVDGEVELSAPSNRFLRNESTYYAVRGNPCLATYLRVPRSLWDYERIILNDRETVRILHYTESNLSVWMDDDENPLRIQP